jgi:hypothetical protein
LKKNSTDQILSLIGLAGLIGLGILVSSCEFKSYRFTYQGGKSIAKSLDYSAELEGKEVGSPGPGLYRTKVQARLWVTGSYDSTKSQWDYKFSMDSLAFVSSERAQDEDKYMQGRLRKYHSRLLLTKTGQILFLDEEPQLPPVEFSPLNFGRFIIYGLPAFPDAPIKKGECWESQQSLLDKFHPESRLHRRYCFLSLQETAYGRIAHFDMTLATRLEEDLKAPKTDTASLKGKGKFVFNLDGGYPISTQIEVEGDFLTPEGVGSNSPDSLPKPPMALHLSLSLNLKFSPSQQ